TILLHPITHASQAEKLTEECLQPQLGKLDRDFLDKLNKLIDDNLSTEEIDIAFLTDKVAMSISTLYRKLKALTGMSANAYVRKRKLHRSMELLKEGRYNVTEVAM
ncbi:helix-turn-helix domain-containing protein, partial [Bacillus pumilus]